jgi:hypothetical protein
MVWSDLPWFTRPTARFTARVAPPDLLPKLGMTALVQDHVWERLSPNIRVRQAFSFHAPVLVGARVRGVGHFHDKYERRVKHFVVMQVVYRGEDGTTLMVDERTQLMLGESVRVVRPDQPVSAVPRSYQLSLAYMVPTPSRATSTARSPRETSCALATPSCRVASS